MRGGYSYGYKVVMSQTRANKINTIIDSGTKTEVALVEGVIG